MLFMSHAALEYDRGHDSVNKYYHHDARGDDVCGRITQVVWRVELVY